MKSRFFLPVTSYFLSKHSPFFSEPVYKIKPTNPTFNTKPKSIGYITAKPFDVITSNHAVSALLLPDAVHKKTFDLQKDSMNLVLSLPAFSSYKNHWIILLLGMMGGAFLNLEDVMAEESIDKKNDIDSDSEILQAIINGDIETLKAKVTTENYFSMTDKENGDTLLLRVAKYGHLEIIQWLLTSGIAKSDEKNKCGVTVLLRCAGYGYHEAVRWLLESGYSNVDEHDSNGDTVSLKASHYAHLNVLKTLLQYSGNEKGIAIVNKKNDFTLTTPLLVAAFACDTSYSHEYTVRAIPKLSEFNEKNTEKDIIYLENADEHGYILRDHEGKIQKGKIQDIDLSDLDRKLQESSFSEEIFKVVVRNRHIPHKDIKKEQYNKFIEFLLKNGADVEGKDNTHCTPLLHAAMNGYKDGVEILLFYGADINAMDNHGVTALHYAVARNKPDFVQFLLEKGANIHAQDKNGKTPMDIIKENLYKRYRSHSHISKTPMDFEEMENKIKDKKEINAKELKALKNQRKIETLLHKKLEEYNDKTEQRLKDIEQKVKSQKEQDIRSIVETFRKNLSEKINVEFYTDKAICERMVKPQAGGFDNFLEIASLVSNASGDMATRIAASLSSLYIKGKLEESRVQEANYTKIFDKKSISEISREAAKMIAERYKEQLWQLSAEGLDDFGQYFCDKLITELKTRYKVRNFGIYIDYDFYVRNRQPIPLVRELYEIMIDPNKGRAITLQLRGKDKRELNRDKKESWNTQELMQNVGIIVKRKYLLTNLDINFVSYNELREKIDSWKKSHDAGSVLFLRTPDEKWHGYFIYNNDEKEKKCDEIVFDQSSELGKFLQSIKTAHLSEEEKLHIQNILKRDQVFKHDELSAFYVLKEVSKKYGVCHGDESDVLDSKFSCCSWGGFWCRPRVVSELSKYEDHTSTTAISEKGFRF